MSGFRFFFLSRNKRKEQSYIGIGLEGLEKMEKKENWVLLPMNNGAKNKWKYRNWTSGQTGFETKTICYHMNGTKNKLKKAKDAYEGSGHLVLRQIENFICEAKMRKCILQQCYSLTQKDTQLELFF
jgi:hypothetical protein